MQKMTNEQTIKALGLCSSEHLGCEDGCPYVEVPCLGGDALLKDARELIKKKDTEIDILIRKNETLKDENFELRAEVERKTTECERLEIYMDELVKQKLNQAKAEAIKEFAGMLKARIREYIFISELEFQCEEVDNLAKELTE